MRTLFGYAASHDFRLNPGLLVFAAMFGLLVQVGVNVNIAKSYCSGNRQKSGKLDGWSARSKWVRKIKIIK